MFPYIERELSKGVYLNHIVRHMLGHFRIAKGARQWRRHLSENATKQGAGVEVVEQALCVYRLRFEDRYLRRSYDRSIFVLSA